PRDAQLPVVAPLEPRVGDHRQRHERRAVRVVALPVVAAERVTVNGGVPPDLAVDRRGVRIEQQLGRIAPQAVLRVVRAVDAVAVALPVADARQEAVPYVAVDLGHVQPLFRGAALVEQAQLDSLCYLGKQREVRPDAVVGGAERIRPARPHGASHGLHLPQRVRTYHGPRFFTYFRAAGYAAAPKAAGQPTTSVMAFCSCASSSMLAAAMFCATCSAEPDPGIGRICGDLASSQAIAISRVLTPCRSAAVRIGTLPDSLIGAHGRNTRLSCSHRSTIVSEDRSVTL